MITLQCNFQSYLLTLVISKRRGNADDSRMYFRKKLTAAMEQRIFFIIGMHQNMNMYMYRYAYIIYNHTSKLYGL